MQGSPLQHRPHPVLLPLAGARVQDEAGGEKVAWTIVASTGGDHRLVSGSEEGGVGLPLAWQEGRGAAGSCRWEYFR